MLSRDIRAEPGVAPYGVTVERREAQPPTSLRVRISDGGPRWARTWCAGRPLRKGSAKGMPRKHPKGSRKTLAPPGAASLVFEDRETGKGDPAPLKHRRHGTASRWLGSFLRQRLADASRENSRQL